MSLQYSCFISYRHNKSSNEKVMSLASDLKEKLEDWTDLDVFVDKERLKIGHFHKKRIAKALCESVCLIVIYVPAYFSDNRTFCAREYKTMELLEEKRLKALQIPENDKNGLILNLVYGGSKNFFPESMKERFFCADFEKWNMRGEANSNNPEYNERITEIADYIRERYDELRVVENEIIDECGSFKMLDESSIDGWLENLLAPMPILQPQEKLPFAKSLNNGK